MKTTIEEIIESRKNWFKGWFNSEFYRKLYTHRNEEEAASFVKALLFELQPSPQSKILDLGCGNGRHARHLAARGHLVTGLDLAFSSIRYARKWQNEKLQFFRHDMREPFGNSCFDYVFNFFTSFGYFDTDLENEQVIANISHSLKNNGWLMMDYINVSQAERNLLPYEERQIDGITYRLKRWTDSKYIHKSIEVDNVRAVELFRFTEKVRKFCTGDFNAMFERHGLKLWQVYGDYALSEYVEESPRLILLAQKRPAG
jgi:SAM-dependent methyltransferase